jgi:Notch-like protein
MRTLAYPALLAYASADETSLMQHQVRANKLSASSESKSNRQDSTSKLLDTAVTMIKNGVTPDVITFVDATNQDINEEVLVAIQSEHDIDQAYINSLCQDFLNAVNALEEQAEAIALHDTNRLAASEAHHSCRANEAYKCAKSRRCEEQLRQKWVEVKHEESTMREIHGYIHDEWCVHPPFDQHDPPAIGDWLNHPFNWAQTSPYPILELPQDVRDFRHVSVGYFRDYHAQKIVTERVWLEYNEKLEECAVLEEAWESQIEPCDEAQIVVREHACSHAQANRQAREAFGQEWNRIVTLFEQARIAKTANEQDRKNEWETLKIVQCLLDHVHSSVVTSIETGAPCPTIDSDPDGVTLAIEDCHIVTRGCGEDSMTAHLCLDWCQPPPVPPLPPVEEPACTPAYIAKEQAQFLAAIQASYTTELTGNTDYPNDPLTAYETVLSPAGWAGCAPPLVCVDCAGTEPQQPCLEHVGGAHTCHMHEEYLSPGQSNADTFRCLDGTCILQAGRCNDIHNCADGSDETGCDSETNHFVPAYLSTNFECPSDFHDDVHFRCGNSQCIEKVGLCNGIDNCADGSDEAACFGVVHVTVEANSGRAITVETLQMNTGVFHDRSYHFDSLGHFTGKTFIKYSNDDKAIDHVHVMTKLRILEPLTVFIVKLDHKSLPWLEAEGYRPTSYTGVSFSGVRETRHKEWDPSLLAEDQFEASEVFSKTFPAGTVSIPGNNGGDGSFLIFLDRPNAEDEFDNRLSAYWEHGDCGVHGNDWNWHWCGQQAGECPNTIENELVSEICASGVAELAAFDGTGEAHSYHRDGCDYFWHAQYRCAARPQKHGEPEFIGCFFDDGARDLGTMVGTTDNPTTNTFELCRAACGDSIYMSLQFGGECFCADAYQTAPQYIEKDISFCDSTNEPCLSTSHNCGGTWHQAIYQINPSPVTHPPPPQSCGVPPGHDNADAVASHEDIPAGGHVMYVCRDGFSIEGSGVFEQTVSCMPNLQFSSIIPCLPTTCGTAPNMRHAMRAPSNMPLQIVHGMSTAYECLPGYQLEGGATTFEIPCTNGVFGTHRGCSALSCGAPPSLDYAIPSAATPTILFPNGVEYDCENGYTVDGSVPSSFEIQCQANGEFSHGACRHVECAAPPLLTEAFAEWTEQGFEAAEGTIVSFTILQYRCMDGFAFANNPLASTKNIECLANGMYSAVQRCSPINDCVGHTCGAFGVCQDLHMNYTCDCLDGYEIHQVENAEGEQEMICGNIDDCHGAQCGEGGTCEDQVGDYTCNCRLGFELVQHGDFKTCERVQCMTPPTVENARIATNRDSGGKTVFEDVTQYECLEGYSTNGHHEGARDFEVTCQEDGTFSEQSECLSIQCGVPPPVAHATCDSESVSFPDAVEYQCEEGYTITGAAGGATSFNKFCTDSGRLLTMSLGQAVVMSCLPVSCGTPPNFDLATVGNSAVHRLGEVAEYTCIEGFTIDGSNPEANTFTSECTSDGSWTDAPGYCTPVTCALPTNADLVGTFNGLPTIAGEQVTIADYTMPIVYHCKDGYTVDGNPSSMREQIGTCNADGELLVSACQPVVCARADIAHREHATIVGQQQDYHFGQTATLQCHDGWEVAAGSGLQSMIQSSNEFLVECLANGQFTPPLYCQNIDDCVGHTCGAHGVCEDGLMDYSCNCDTGFEENVIDGEKICGNIDDCDGVSCGARGTCVDHVNRFECDCAVGYLNEGDATSQCVPQTCTLPAQANSEVTDPVTLTFPNSYIVKCADGYETATGPLFPVSCSPDGSIAPALPTSEPVCQPKVCGLAPPIPYAATTPDYNHPFVYGEAANYVCQGGSPSIEIPCGANGWLPPTGAMTCQTSCGNPQRPFNGFRHGQGAVFHPQSAELSCDEGYTHLRSGAFSEESSLLTQHCQATGQYVAWDSEVSVSATEPGRLECVAVQCSRPDAPANWRWSGNGAFDTTTPAVLECEPGHSSNGMQHASTVWSVECGADGQHAQLPEPCVPITHRIQCTVDDAVSGALLANAHVVVTDAGGNEFTRTSNAQGVWSIEHVQAGTCSISVTLDTYTFMETTVNVQENMYGGLCNAALSPHLAAHEWRAVLQWGANPRDLDGHVTRHAGSNGRSLNECPCSQRTHLFWQQTWMRSMRTHPFLWWVQEEDPNKPAARLDRDHTMGEGTPETITFFKLDTCQDDCLFVYRVWDYCSMENAMVQESGAVVKLYNAGGLHSEYRIGQQGSMHSEDGGRVKWNGDTLWEKRWDVFAIDTSDGQLTVSDCSAGGCPDEETDPWGNHNYC